MSAPLHSCLYQGTVMHHRLVPVRHRFTYAVFSLLIDLDELEQISSSSWLLGIERATLFQFRSIDHGARDGTALKPWVAERLASSGITIADLRVRLLCFPRMLGYAFNPLSVYFCFAGDELRAIVYEVKNTFGDQHCYVLPVVVDGSGRPQGQSCAKQLYVSPFIAMNAFYRFRLDVPGRDLNLVIHETVEETLVLVARHTGRRIPLCDRSLLNAFLGNFLMTMKVIIGIHWEATRLWLKGVPYYARPSRQP